MTPLSPFLVDPSSSKDESGLNGASPPPGQTTGNVQVYHYTQQQQQMMAGVQRPPPVAIVPPPQQPPPQTTTNSSSSGLLWEPRDPPLQYSGINSFQQQPNLRHHHHQHHQGVSKTRLEPRRSASLSQADLVLYDGKMLARLQPQSQSPPQQQPQQQSSGHVARYHDYYETKYEKPVRLTTAVGSTSITNITTGGDRGAGVDVDTIWKSRWRSTSPPPAPVDDWLPIKPPQLAWAKPAQVVSAQNKGGGGPGSRSRIPIATTTTTTTQNTNNSSSATLLMARSMSGDMDHMIYLDRDMQVPPLTMRERTRSIDHGLQQQSASSGNGSKQRQQFKTYEEELADYHGRTGSVDRLAAQQQKRGRQRNNIRMGIGMGISHQVQPTQQSNDNRRVSLERRHSEVGLNTSSGSGSGGGGRRPSGGESSNNSTSSGGGGGGGRRSNSNETVKKAMMLPPQSRPSPPRSVSHGNVNRVYLDGPPDTYAVSRSSAIRVTMTETRSLKRPSTNRLLPTTNSSTTGESSTMPRMNKRHHAGAPSPPQKSTSGSTTTVYLAGGSQATPTNDTGKPCCCLRFNRQSAFYFHLSPLQQTVL